MASVHLTRTFRRFLGRSPGELARALRIRRACEDLAAHDKRLADIALDAGFADQAHMTRLFVRHCGWTPGAVRDALRPSPGATVTVPPPHAPPSSRRTT